MGTIRAGSGAITKTPQPPFQTVLQPPLRHAHDRAFEAAACAPTPLPGGLPVCLAVPVTSLLRLAVRHCAATRDAAPPMPRGAGGCGSTSTRPRCCAWFCREAGRRQASRGTSRESAAAAGRRCAATGGTRAFPRTVTPGSLQWSVGKRGRWDSDDALQKTNDAAKRQLTIQIKVNQCAVDSQRYGAAVSDAVSCVQCRQPRANVVEGTIDARSAPAHEPCNVRREMVDEAARAAAPSSPTRASEGGEKQSSNTDAVTA